MDIKKKEIIKRSVAVTMIIFVIVAVVLIIIKYQVSGETNMPFYLTKITIISTAEGTQNNDNSDTKWDMNINQSNDIYFFIDKNGEYKKQATIDSITIENINIVQSPAKGTVKVYMPNSGNGMRYVYDDAFLVNNSLTYKGAKASNEKNLEIGNQGGKALIRFANTNIDTYKSNDVAEIKHDGTLIGKTNTKNEDIKFTVNFDFIICSRNIKYKANITLDLPYDNIIESGTTELEKTDMSDIVFKRM